MSMDRRNFLQTLAGAAALSTVPRALAQPGKPPNIVVLLVDDLGWGDFGCYGSTFHETPNIDAFARESLKFTDAYAAGPVCSPSRAGLMTGQAPARVHITDYIPGSRMKGKKLIDAPILDALPAGTPTLGTEMKKLGYQTCYVGKWHLGGEGSLPENFGFDINYGGDAHGEPSWPSHYFGPFEAHNLSGYSKNDYLTEVLSDKADSFLEKATQSSRPFFLYLAEYAVHMPLMARDALVEKYRRKNGGKNQPDPVYAAMVETVDAALGRLRARLKSLGIEQNTIIILTSDNGGISYLAGKLQPMADNGPFRAGKGFLYEGGIREPLVINWPGVTHPGTTTDVPVTFQDFMPTLLHMAGGSAVPQPCDGIDLVPLIRDPAQATPELRERPLFWHYPHYHGQGGTPASAMREGDWKLVEWLEDGHIELYNLRMDSGERYPLAMPYEKRAREMLAKLHAWRREVNAPMPSPNPAYVSPAL